MPAAAERLRRYLPEASAGGRPIVRAGKSLPTALCEGKLDPGVESVLAEGVQLGKIG